MVSLYALVKQWPLLFSTVLVFLLLSSILPHFELHIWKAICDGFRSKKVVLHSVGCAIIAQRIIKGVSNIDVFAFFRPKT